MKARLVKLKNFIADNVYIIAAMLAVDFIMAFVFYYKELVPFGPNTIIQMDLQHQYWPLFTELYDRLTEHKSLVYSWNTGLGGPFLGNFYNYLSSPFLVYILIAGRNYIAEAISMMVVSKASLAAGTFAYYLKKSQNNHNLFTAAFGVLYAQSAWFVAYYWNVMWLDALYLLPLVVLGIEKLIKDKKPLLYIITLALTLLTNYYMGYMVCIFSVIWFIVYYFSNYRFVTDTGEHIGTLGEKRTLFEKLRGSLFINRGFTFAFSSIIAAGLVAFALVPTFVILKNCSATSGSFPKEIKSYFGVFEYLITHLPAISPSIRIGDYNRVPNVYCGVITLVMIPLYFLSKEIRLKEKIISLVTLLLFYFSFSINILDYVWHGLHFPNDLPERFSFLYVFLLLVLSFRAINTIQKSNWISIIVSLAVPFILIIVGKFYEVGKFGTSTFIVGVTFGIITCIMILLMRTNKLQESFCMLLTFSLIIVELCFTNTGFYDGLFNEKAVLYGSVAEYNKLNEKLDKLNGQFYRMDSNDNNDCFMKPALMGYNGTTIFSSMAYYNMTQIQDKLGEENNERNCYAYNWQTPVYNMMHAIRYVVSQNGDCANEYYSISEKSGSLQAWENNYFLSLGFNADKNIMKWETDDYNPFVTQNNWFESVTGESGLFIENEVEYDKNLEYSNGVYSISDEYGKSRSIDFNFKIKEAKHTYVYFETQKNNNYFNYDVNGTRYSYIEPFIVDVGVVQAGEDVVVTLPFGNYNTTEKNCKCVVYCYSIDDEVLNKGYEKLKKNQLEISSFEETNIKGTIVADESGIMWTSIPYDSGWNVRIDKKVVDTIAVQDAYLCFELPEGEHTIELSYNQKGLKEGLYISVIVALVLVCMTIKRRKDEAKN
ncbi:MAG: YfhO family protein [Clostridia bacterium]|nr:YfhO family protein [Clostridia bacterium]